MTLTAESIEVVALKLLALLGLVNSDDKGQISINFDWLLDSSKRDIKTSLRRNREEIDQILRILCDQMSTQFEHVVAASNVECIENNNPSRPYLEEYNEQKYSFIPIVKPSEKMAFGLAFNNKQNKETTWESIPFSFGLSANYYIEKATQPSTSETSDQAISIFIELMSVSANGTLTFGPGSILASVDLRSPLDFIDSISLRIAGSVAEPAPQITLRGKSYEGDKTREKFLKAKQLPIRAFTSDLGQWNLLRLGTFAATEYLISQASSSDSIEFRACEQLLPAFGYPWSTFTADLNSIKPIPPLSFADPQNDDFSKWLGSIIESDGSGIDVFGNYPRANQFIAHIYTFITGDKKNKCNEGSLYLPIFSGNDSSICLVFSQPDGALPASISLRILSSNPSSQGEWKAKLQLYPKGDVGQDIKNLRAELEGMKFNVSNSAITVKYANNTLQFKSNIPTPDAQNWEFGVNLVLSDTNPVLMVWAKCEAVVQFSVKHTLNFTRDPVVSLAIGEWLIFGDGVQKATFNLSSLLESHLNDQSEKSAISAIQCLIEKDYSHALINLIKAVGDERQVEISTSPYGVNLKADEAANRLYVEAIASNLPIKAGGDRPRVRAIDLQASLGLLADKPNPPNPQLKLTLRDFRLGKIDTGSGIAGQMLPNFSDFPGLDLEVGFGERFTLGGKASVPVQYKIGPFELHKITFGADTDSINAKLDGRFALGPLEVHPVGLGVDIRKKEDGSGGTRARASLDGLSIALNVPAVTLSGFLRTKGEENYEGAATIQLLGWGGITAIGGFSNNPRSLYTFAALKGPIGGPPFFFITGFAGGFGYNRSLPAADIEVADHPFMIALRSPEKLNAVLVDNSDAFRVSEGNSWFAGGVSFNSLGLFDGSLIGIIQFDGPFSVQMLGRAEFTKLEPLLRMVVDMQLYASAEQLSMRAGLSGECYVVHPDFIKPQGEVGFGAWYGCSPYAGDFYFTAGGFMAEAKPAHYPDLDRLGAKLRQGLITITETAFLGITPRALMAGASLSVEGSFAGIGAGLDAYAQVYMRYDPFFIRAQMGACVWFRFLGRHEVSVNLDVWSPPFGGIATVEFDILFDEVEFDIDFGAKGSPDGKKLSIPEFIERQLKVAKLTDTGLFLPLSSSTNSASLLRLDVTKGRSRTYPKADAPATTQDDCGTSQENPIEVDVDFSVALRTRLPLNTSNAPIVQYEESRSRVITCTTNDISLPMCEAEGLSSSLKLKITPSTVVQKESAIACRLLEPQPVPQALFGKIIPMAGTSSGDMIAHEKSEATVNRVDGFEVIFSSVTAPAETEEWWGLRELEESSGDESDGNFPLPWGDQHRLRPLRAPVSGQRARHAVARRPALVVRHYVSEKASEQKTMKVAASEALPIVRRTHSVLRPVRPIRLISAVRDLTLPRTAIPASPLRITAMDRVRLRVIPRADSAGANNTLATTVPLTIRRAIVHHKPQISSDAIVQKIRLGEPDGSAQFKKWPAPTLAPREMVHLQLDQAMHEFQGTVMTAAVRPAGAILGAVQWVRLVSMDALGSVKQDGYRNSGALLPQQRAMPVMRGTRQILAINEGRSSPVRPDWPTGIAEPIGFEPGSRLLGLGLRNLAAHGCTVSVDEGMREPYELMHSYLAESVLAQARKLVIRWPAMPRGSCLILRVSGQTNDTPQPLVWSASGATTTAALTYERPTHGVRVLLMDVMAEQNWQLSITLQSGWRLDSAICAPMAATAAHARTQGGCLDWIDNAEEGLDASDINLNLELSA